MNIIRKILKQKCYKCDGTGKVKNQPCNVCKGSGFWKDFINYYINDKKKIAFMGENGQ